MADEEMMASNWNRFKKEAGWVGLVISVLVGQATCTNVLKPVISGMTIDSHGWELFLRVFVATTPLTIAAVIFFSLAFAGQLKNGVQILVAGAFALLGGLAIGEGLGNSSGIDPYKAENFISSFGGGHPLVRAFMTIVWFLTAYYQTYGWANFASSIILGAFFGKWGAWLRLESQSPSGRWGKAGVLETKSLPINKPGTIPQAQPFMAPLRKTLAASTSDIHSLKGRVINLRFYEGGDMPPLSERAFSELFEATTARFICCQLDLTYQASGHQRAVPVRFVFHRNDGKVFGESSLTIQIPPGSTEICESGGVGWSDPGNWPGGRYRVECQANGMVIGKGTFMVKQ
jgi:hypothetical protein